MPAIHPAKSTPLRFARHTDRQSLSRPLERLLNDPLDAPPIEEDLVAFWAKSPRPQATFLERSFARLLSTDLPDLTIYVIAILPLQGLRKDFSFDARSEAGETFLHQAVKRPFIIKQLLKRMSDETINAQDDDGFTTLHWATLMGERAQKSIPLLMERMSKEVLLALDNQGWTPVDYAPDTIAKEFLQALCQRLTRSEKEFSEKLIKEILAEFRKSARPGIPTLLRSETLERLTNLHHPGSR